MLVTTQNTQRVARGLKHVHDIGLDPTHAIDTHVKRIHEYKRQLLNVLHVIWLYLRISRDPATAGVPRTFVFSGKAAPGYAMAKQIVHLINAVARHVNQDARVRDVLRVVFVPNYGVTQAEQIIPASDVSEQISTAGMEASGTGCMKFALNGAITIGTLDGANIEMKDAIGNDNIFIFGLTAAQVEQKKVAGYSPLELYKADPELAEVIDAIAGGRFSPGSPDAFRGIVDSLLGDDRYFVLADFRSYQRAHRLLSETYADRERWAEMCILNVARMGWFSSDRTLRGYARDIWDVPV
jgi:starch phosphorylase